MYETIGIEPLPGPYSRKTRYEMAEKKANDPYYAYRKYDSIEAAIEKAWYPNDMDPVCVKHWHVEDAKRDLTGNHNHIGPKAIQQWYRGRARTEKIIKKRLAEALLSDAPYIREYARLLGEQLNKIA